MSLYGDSPRSTFSWHYRAPSLTDTRRHSYDCGGSVGHDLYRGILTRCSDGGGIRASEGLAIPVPPRRESLGSA